MGNRDLKSVMRAVKLTGALGIGLALAGCDAAYVGTSYGGYGGYTSGLYWNDYYGGHRPPPPPRPGGPDRPNPPGAGNPGGRPPAARPPSVRPPISRPGGGGGHFGGGGHRGGGGRR